MLVLCMLALLGMLLLLNVSVAVLASVALLFVLVVVLCSSGSWPTRRLNVISPPIPVSSGQRNALEISAMTVRVENVFQLVRIFIHVEMALNDKFLLKRDTVLQSYRSS